MNGINHFRVLRVRTNASQDDIKSAYRRRARETHPDQGGSSDDFAQVQEAYETLTNPTRRAEWQESYLDEAASLGHFVCSECFAVNRVRTVRAGVTVRCAGCKSVLDVTPDEWEARYKGALRDQVSDLVITLGAETGSLAKDAIVAAAEGIRRKLKIHRGS